MLAEWTTLSRSEIIIEGCLRTQNSSFVSVRSSVAEFGIQYSYKSIVNMQTHIKKRTFQASTSFKMWRKKYVYTLHIV